MVCLHVATSMINVYVRSRASLKEHMALEVKENNVVIFQEKAGKYIHRYTLKNIPAYFFHYFGFLASILLI